MGGISRLRLINFRNHTNFEISSISSDINLIVGPNGSGKSNVLESISLLSPGKGMRGAKLSEISNNNAVSEVTCSEWAAIFDLPRCELNISYAEKASRETKLIKEDTNILKSSRLLLDRLKIVWFVPQMSYLFVQGSEDRRKFFDRIVYNHYPEHASNIIKYKKLVRSRMKVLKGGGHNFNSKWLETLEWQISDVTEHIVLKRALILESVMQALEEHFSEDWYPKLSIVSKYLNLHTNGFSKDTFASSLYANREKDTITGRTNLGPHTDDISAIHSKKLMAVRLCSTGEQKSAVFKIIITHLKNLRKLCNYSMPIVMLLDDIFAHIDGENRALIMETIRDTPDIQKWISGTEEDLTFCNKLHSSFSKDCMIKKINL